MLHSLEVSGMEHCHAARMMSRAQLEMASMGAGEAWARLAVHCGHEGHVHGAAKLTYLYYSIGGCANILDSSRSNKVQKAIFLTSESKKRLRLYALSRQRSMRADPNTWSAAWPAGSTLL